MKCFFFVSDTKIRINLFSVQIFFEVFFKKSHDLTYINKNRSFELPNVITA